MIWALFFGVCPGRPGLDDLDVRVSRRGALGSPLSRDVPQMPPTQEQGKNIFSLLSGLEKRLQKVSPKVQKWSPKGIPNR